MRTFFILVGALLLLPFGKAKAGNIYEPNENFKPILPPRPTKPPSARHVSPRNLATNKTVSEDACRKAIKRIDELHKKLPPDLNSNSLKVYMNFHDFVQAHLWRSDAISAYNFARQKAERRMKSSINQRFSTSIEHDFREWLRTAKNALEIQLSPRYQWRFPNPQYEDAVRRLASPEEKIRLTERLEEKWKKREIKSFSDRFLDLAQASGVSQNVLSAVDKDAIRKYFSDRPDIIQMITEILKNGVLEYSNLTLTPIFKDLGIAEEEFNLFVENQWPVLKNFWERDREKPVPEFVVEFHKEYNYAPISPLSGVYARYLIERLIEDPTALVIPSPIASVYRNILVATAEYQAVVIFAEDGSVRHVVPMSYTEKQMKEMIPSTPYDAAVPLKVSAPSVKQATLTTQVKPVASKIPEQKIERKARALDASKLQNLRSEVRARIEELNAQYPGHEIVLEDHLVSVLTMMPWLEKEAEWNKFQKGLALTLKVNLNSEAAVVDSLLKLAVEHETKYLQALRVREIEAQRALGQTSFEPEEIVEAPAPLVEAKLETPREFEYDESRRSPLRSLARKDLDALYSELSSKYHRRLTDLSLYLSRYDEAERRAVLNLFIDWMTVEGSPVADFGRRHPFFDEIVRRDATRPVHDFNYWIHVRYLNQQESTIGTQDGTPTFVFDSSVLGRNTDDPNVKSFVEIRHQLAKAIDAEISRTEIVPSVTREMAHSVATLSRQALGDLHIPYRLARPVVNGEMNERQELARVLTQLGVGVVPDKFEDVTGDAKVVADVALISEKAKNPYWFITQDTNLFRPLLRMADSVAPVVIGNWRIRSELERHIRVGDLLVPVLKLRISGPIKAQFRVVHPYWRNYWRELSNLVTPD